MVAIGKMDKRITFRSATVTADTSAGATATYSNWFETWAHLKRMSSKRSFEYGMDDKKTNYDMYCRYRSSLEAALSKNTRVMYNGKDYGIIGEPELIDEREFIYHFKLEGVS